MKTQLVALLLTVALVGCGAAPEPPAAAEAASVTPLKVTPVAFTEAGDPVVEFKAPAMHCEACAATIVTSLKKRDAVLDATADAETKVVSVTLSKEGFDPESSNAAGEVVAAIAEAGFGEATPVVDSASTEEAAAEEVAGDTAATS